MSPTSSPVKVPTANQQSFTELSISDMTSLTGVNTTSLLSGGQQELGEQGHGQTSRGVQGKQQGEAEESSPVWKEMPKPHFPARGILVVVITPCVAVNIRTHQTQVVDCVKLASSSTN